MNKKECLRPSKSMERRIKVIIILASLIVFPLFASAGERVSVAIFPLRINAPEGMEYLRGAMTDMLSSRVGSGGEIHIVEETRIREALARYGGPDDSEEVRRFLAGEVGADYVISGSLSVIGEGISLDVEILDAAQEKGTPLAFKGSGLNALIGMVDKLAYEVRTIIVGSGRLAEVKEGGYTGKFAAGSAVEVPPTRKGEGFIIERAQEGAPWKSRRFPRAFKGLEVADLDGDGTNEVILIDKRALFLYEMREGKLALREERKEKAFYTNFGISVGDLNGNGSPEIYLTRMGSSSPSSLVVEMRGGKLETILEGLPWFVRTLKRPGRQPVLIGQKFREADGFYGDVTVLKWEGEELKEHGSLDLPKGTGLYGFTLIDILENGREEILSLDERDRLRLYEKEEGGEWKQVWKSPGYYGGTLNTIELAAMEGSFEAEETINIKGRIHTTIGDDGAQMVVINSNEPGGMGRAFKHITSYKSGEIFGLAWDGVGFYERWRSKEISGYIADYMIGDLDGDGGDELIILVVEKFPGLFRKGESFIVAYPIGRSGARSSVR
ncbi:MAG: FG-GAP-like repeat-containing protein [Thermodesulfobacteriota bacterium]